jgi:DNA invertase Pin-like site-specific DNA recombinase
MNELLVGYARVSTEQQDLTAQRNGLHALGVSDDRIYVDHGLTGTNRDRPGLTLALAACRAGDTLVVTKLDRLARSLPDARDILDELTKRNVKLSLGGSIHDPTDPVGRLLFNVLAMVAEFESALIRLRTREGLKVAKAKGRLRGKQPKLKPNQARHLLELHDSGNYTQAELAELFGVGRSTIYRTIDRMRPKPVDRERPFAQRAMPAVTNPKTSRRSLSRLIEATCRRHSRRMRSKQAARHESGPLRQVLRSLQTANSRYRDTPLGKRNRDTKPVSQTERLPEAWRRLQDHSLGLGPRARAPTIAAYAIPTMDRSRCCFPVDAPRGAAFLARVMSGTTAPGGIRGGRDDHTG